jgi:hypothetical protein
MEGNCIFHICRTTTSCSQPQILIHLLEIRQSSSFQILRLHPSILQRVFNIYPSSFQNFSSLYLLGTDVTGKIRITQRRLLTYKSHRHVVQTFSTNETTAFESRRYSHHIRSGGKVQFVGAV